MTDERTKEALKELAAKQQRDYEESFKRAENQTQINNMSLIEKTVQRDEMIKRLNENARRTVENDRIKAQERLDANQSTNPIEKTVNLQGKIIQGKEALLVEALPTLRAYSNLLLNERRRFDESHLSKLRKAVEDAVDAYKNAYGDLIIYLNAQVEVFRRAVR